MVVVVEVVEVVLVVVDVVVVLVVDVVVVVDPRKVHEQSPGTCDAPSIGAPREPIEGVTKV